MLAQDRHDGSDLTGRPAPKRQSRRPTNFMFIDSSNGGVNAKPDRVVRSFVMKSARNRKNWSTRPKSPKEEDVVDERPQRQASNHIETQHDPTFSAESWSSQDYRKDSLWDNHSLASPASSRSGSIFSAYNGSRTCDSPSSCHTSPFVEHTYPEHAYNFPLGQHAALMPREGCDISFTRPFDCLSVRLDARTQRLLHQFVEGSAPRLVPLDPHRLSSVAATDWIANCIQSPNGMPYIYAALTASARAVGLASEAYKWRAITEVNKLLSNPRTSTDDTIIATIFILLNMEESDLADPKRQGSEREWSLRANNAHLNGLRTMIGQRGGLAALASNRCLQTFILMHSIAQCITTFKRPYALLLNPIGQIEDYTTAPHFSTFRMTLSTPFQRLTSDAALLRIAHSIHLFITDLADWYSTGRTPDQLDPFDLQKHASLLIYRLFDWYQTGEESELIGGLGRNATDKSICLAHLILMVVATEPHVQSFGSRLSKIVVKLRKALQRTSLSTWAMSPDLFLWILTMGALGAKGLPCSQRSCASEFAFFVQYAHLAFSPNEQAGYTTSHDLLRRIQRCPWISSVFDARVRRLWAQMGLCVPDAVDMYESSSEEEEGLVDDEHAVGQSTTARFFPAMKAGGMKMSPR